MSAESFLQCLQVHDDYLVLTHCNPDADAVGSAAAMAVVLQKLGKRFALASASGVSPQLSWLPLPAVFHADRMSLPFEPATVLILDCGEEKRLDTEFIALAQKTPRLVLDHHQGYAGYATHGEWVDAGKPATAQLVAEIAQAAGIVLQGDLAVYLYIALIADTGSFSYGQHVEEAMKTSAEMIQHGLDIIKVRDLFDNQWTLARLHLWGELMRRQELFCNGRVALASVSQELLAQFGAGKADLEGYVEQVRRIHGVRVVGLLREEDGSCRASLRSSGTDDVRAVALLFDGGGHRNAAGLTIHAELGQAREQLLIAIEKQFSF